MQRWWVAVLGVTFAVASGAAVRGQAMYDPKPGEYKRGQADDLAAAIGGLDLPKDVRAKVAARAQAMQAALAAWDREHGEAIRPLQQQLEEAQTAFWQLQSEREDLVARQRAVIAELLTPEQKTVWYTYKKREEQAGFGRKRKWTGERSAPVTAITTADFDAADIIGTVSGLSTNGFLATNVYLRITLDSPSRPGEPYYEYGFDRYRKCSDPVFICADTNAFTAGEVVVGPILFKEARSEPGAWRSIRAFTIFGMLSKFNPATPLQGPIVIAPVSTSIQTDAKRGRVKAR